MFDATKGQVLAIFFQQNFQDIILAPSQADKNTQKQNWGHLKKSHFFYQTPPIFGGGDMFCQFIVFRQIAGNEVLGRLKAILTFCHLKAILTMFATPYFYR